MIEKRFWYDFEDCNGPKIVDFKKDKEYPLETIGDLNNLSDENDQLKQSKKELQFQLNICADHRNEFHRGARENANRVGKLEKENEQLKKENNELKMVMPIL